MKPGDKVGASEATLLNMLNISPFSYGLIVEQVYDSGTIFAPEILDIKPEDLREKFLAGVANLASVCLAIGYPTVASAPHSIAYGFKNLLAIAAVTEVDFAEATTIKEYIKVRRYSFSFAVEKLRNSIRLFAFFKKRLNDEQLHVRVVDQRSDARNSRTHLVAGYVVDKSILCRLIKL